MAIEQKRTAQPALASIVCALCILLCGLAEVSSAQAETSWIDEDPIVSNDMFYFARGSGATLEEARTAALTEFTLMIESRVRVEATDEQDLVTRERYLDAAREFHQRVSVGGLAAIQGAFIDKRATRNGVVWVLMKVPRQSMPQGIQDAVQPWDPGREATILVNSRSVRSVVIQQGFADRVRHDDTFELFGLQPGLPIRRSFGVGRISSVEDGTATLDLFTEHDLPEAKDMWVVPRGDSGLSLSALPMLVLLDAPRLDDFDLEYDAQTSALGIGLGFGLNVGKTVFGMTELWLALEPQIAVAGPLTLFGINMLLRKGFRLGAFSIGFGAGGAFTLRVLDTEGTSINLNGSPPDSLGQTAFGAAGHGEVAWYLHYAFAIVARVGFRYLPESTIWEGLDLDYAVNETNIAVSLGVTWRL